MNYPHKITIQRLVETAGRSTYQNLSTDMPAFVQPLDIETTDQINETFAKSSYVYLAINVVIDQNDRVIYDGDSYNVKGVKKYKYGSLTHKKALIEEL